MDSAADYYKKNAVPLYIETVKGNRFYFDNPSFDIEEIAHALSMQCRYTGHCKRFYSVAEHSVLVATLVETLKLGDPFEGLMHDGQEAYLSDIAAPWKVMLPDYKRMELALETKLRASYGFSPTISSGVKRADWIALFIEARELLPSKAQDWSAPEGIKEQAHLFSGDLIHCLAPKEARDLFLEAFALLGGPRGFR